MRLRKLSLPTLAVLLLAGLASAATVVYRTVGPWGVGKGGVLSWAELDTNFYNLDVQATADRTAALSRADAASTASGKGASLVGVYDTAARFTLTTVEGALTEVPTFAELASTAAAKGASYSGVQDSSGYFTGTTVEAVLAEIGSRLFYPLQITTGAKLGSTGSGWTLNDATDRGGLAKCPASQTAETIVVPLSGVRVGQKITGYTVRGQIESGGNLATLDCALRKVTVAAPDLTDSSIASASITQVSVTADTAVAATVTGLSETVAAGTSYYFLLTATTAASTDIDLASIDVTFGP